MPQPLLLSVVALLGLAVGSFLNVVIHRVPRDESLVRPGSHCPRCGAAVRSRHNVPVLGWLLLRGRCADCKAPISARYPFVEAATAALFVAVAARFGLTWELPAYLYLAAVAIALAAIDIDHKRLPFAIVVPSYSVGLVLLLLPTVVERDWAASSRGIIAAAALFVFFYVVSMFGMGFGDVALAPLLGLFLGWLGWGSVVVGVFAGFLLGGVVGSILLLTRRATGKTAIPYGPYMLAGAFVAVFAGAPVAHWYLSLLTPTV